MKISAKTRLICLIVALVFALGSLVGTGTYLIINHLNKSKAITSSNFTSIGNMISSTNNSLVDYNTYSALMTKLGNDTTSTRKKSAINGGTPVVFQMGTVPRTSTPIYWEVVYQTGDTITVWMTANYDENAVFDYKGNPDNYTSESNYSTSTLREQVIEIYNELNSNYPIFNKVVKSPSDAGVSSWQSYQNNIKAHGNILVVTNGLGTQTNETNPNGWQWSSCMNDMFWIPSSYEITNTSESVVSTEANGYWGLNEEDINFAGGGSSWLRSSSSENDFEAAVLIGGGDLGITYFAVTTKNSFGIRPAAHLSLSALEETLPSYTITTNHTPANSGTVSGGGTYKQGKTVTLTATPATGYQLKGWSTNGGSTIIQGSEGQTSYPITVTGNTTYTAVFEPIMYMVTTAVYPTGAGTVSGGGSYQQGTQATLTASANNGYKFIGWDTNGNNQHESTEPTANPYNFPVSGNILVTAIFEKLPTITITTNNENYGKILYNNSLTTSTELIQDSGTQITNIYAVPNAGYVFLYWLDTTTQEQYAVNPLNYTVSNDVTITAVFGKSVDGVAVSIAYQNTDGTISTSQDNISLAAIGEARITGYTTTNGLNEITVIAVAYTGYEFKGWMIDGEYITYIDDNDQTIILTGAQYMSARIPLDIANGKQVFAVFAPISNINDMNTETDNGQTTDFV